MGGRSGVSITPVGTTDTSTASMRPDVGTSAAMLGMSGKQAATPRQAAKLQCPFAQGSPAGTCCFVPMPSHGIFIGVVAAGMLATASFTAAADAIAPARLINTTRARCRARRLSVRNGMDKF